MSLIAAAAGLALGVALPIWSVAPAERSAPGDAPAVLAMPNPEPEVEHVPPRFARPGAKKPAQPPEPGPQPVSQPASPAPHSAPEASQSAVPSASEIIEALMRGNQRWIADECQSPNTSPARREHVATKGQVPMATVLTCADSRVPVERIFDVGVGDLFVIRVAGNVAGVSEAASIEYALGHLHTPVLIVMGHSSCGAVKAAVAGTEAHGAVSHLLAHIEPAVDRARACLPEADERLLMGASVRENVWQSITDLLRESREIRAAAIGGELTILGAVYDISSGRVDILGEHPWQTELLAAYHNESDATGR